MDPRDVITKSMTVERVKKFVWRRKGKRVRIKKVPLKVDEPTQELFGRLQEISEEKGKIYFDLSGGKLGSQEEGQFVMFLRPPSSCRILMGVKADSRRWGLPKIAEYPEEVFEQVGGRVRMKSKPLPNAKPIWGSYQILPKFKRVNIHFYAVYPDERFVTRLKGRIKRKHPHVRSYDFGAYTTGP